MTYKDLELRSYDLTNVETTTQILNNLIYKLNNREQLSLIIDIRELTKLDFTEACCPLKHVAMGINILMLQWSCYPLIII